MVKIIDNFKEQDRKQQILFVVFVVVVLITAYVVYSNFLKKPTAKVETSSKELKPLNLNLRVLDSETFSNLKNN